MKHMKKAVLFAAVCCMAFSGCGKSNDDAVEETTESTEIVESETIEEIPTETEEEVVIDDSNRNPLTGEEMDETIAAQRPVTCMIGNTTDAMPQYGVGDADITCRPLSRSEAAVIITHICPMNLRPFTYTMDRLFMQRKC